MKLGNSVHRVVIFLKYNWNRHEREGEAGENMEARHHRGIDSATDNFYGNRALGLISISALSRKESGGQRTRDLGYTYLL